MVGDEHPQNGPAPEDLRRRLETLQEEMHDLRRLLEQRGEGEPTTAPRANEEPSVEPGPVPRLADAAYEVLQSRSRAAHYALLAWELWQRGLLRGSQQPEATLLSTLQRDARFQSLEDTAERGVYALGEWPLERKELPGSELHQLRLEGRMARRRLEAARVRQRLQEAEEALGLGGLVGEALRRFQGYRRTLQRQLERAEHGLRRLEAEAQRWGQDDWLADLVRSWDRRRRPEEGDGGLPLGAEHQETSEELFHLGPSPTIVVQNDRGGIRILGSAESAIGLKVVKRVQVTGEEEPELGLARLRVETGVEGETLRVSAHREPEVGQRFRRLVNDVLEDLQAPGPRQFEGLARRVVGALRDAFDEVQEIARSELGPGHGQVDLILTVPHGSQVDLRSGSGEVAVHDLQGATTITVGSGDVEGADLGDVQVQSASGAIQLERCRGAVELSTISGDIQVSEVAQMLRVRTANGDVVATNIHGPVEVHTASGDVRLSGSIQQPVDLHTASGDIDLMVERDSSFRLDLRTISGTVSVRLPLQEVQRSSRSLTGSYGSGQAALRARTVSGDLRLRQR